MDTSAVMMLISALLCLHSHTGFLLEGPGLEVISGVRAPPLVGLTTSCSGMEGICTGLLGLFSAVVSEHSNTQLCPQPADSVL